jgi:ribosomal protein S19
MSNLLNPVKSFTKLNLLKKITIKKHSKDFFLKNIKYSKLKLKLKNTKFYILWSKNILIDSSMLGLVFIVYNGNTFFPLIIKEYMLKHKVGEFIITKSLGHQIHTEKKKKK